MLEFTRDMLVGVPKIDEQHKELVRMLNTAQSLGIKAFSDAETKKTLDFLGDYVVKHFSDEESLQRQYGYPKYDWHKTQHKNFIEEFVRLKQEFSANGASAKFTLSLNKSVIEWVIKHIKTADAEFGRHYQANRRA